MAAFYIRFDGSFLHHLQFKTDSSSTVRFCVLPCLHDCMQS